MGKTVESYRIAIEDEISRWNGFAKALRKEEREAFDNLIDACRNYASAGSNATQPLPLDPMLMSMLVSQQIHLQKLQKEIDKLKQQQENLEVQ
ncbi:MAG TPA: hypothetical protein VF350_00575 [Candidatus Bathyarchaeia archaeon]